MESPIYLWIVGMVVGLIIIFNIISMMTSKISSDREKGSPFECGFDCFKTSSSPFSLRFFLVAIIFLVFDVEIVILMPAGILVETFGLSEYNLVCALGILIILIGGLLHEWNKGALRWFTL